MNFSGHARAALACWSRPCATSPTGRRQLMLVSEDQAISASRQRMCRRWASTRSRQALTDPQVVKRVQVITERLVAQDPDAAGQREVAVERRSSTSRRPSMPGAWRRAMASTGPDHQGGSTTTNWPMVMGHEIAHALAITRRAHVEPRWRTNAAILTAGLLSHPGQTMALAATAATSRSSCRTTALERGRPDRIELAARRAMTACGRELWQKMGKVGAAPAEFLSTHPSDATRQQRTPAPVAADDAVLPGARSATRAPVAHGAGGVADHSVRPYERGGPPRRQSRRCVPTSVRSPHGTAS